jgi:hypothetical protein
LTSSEKEKVLPESENENLYFYIRRVLKIGKLKKISRVYEPTSIVKYSISIPRSGTGYY